MMQIATPTCRVPNRHEFYCESENATFAERTATMVAGSSTAHRALCSTICYLPFAICHLPFVIFDSHRARKKARMGTSQA
jgi:hypothetical protein